MKTGKKSQKKPLDPGKTNAGTSTTDGRSSITGVMNPYTLVKLLHHLKSHHHVDMIDIDDPETLRLMNAHFKKNRQVKKEWTYKTLRKNLFDPKQSPLYKPLKGISENYYPVGTGRASPAITNPPKTYGAIAAANFIKKVAGNRWDIFGDVIQGSATDCYLHAALYSSAWKNYATWPLNNINSIGFWSNKTYTKVAVTATFPRDVNTNPVYAQKSPAPDSEYWVMAWEKAFAEYRNLPLSTLSGATGVKGVYPYDPEIGAFSQDDALTTLQNVCPGGLAYDFTTAKFGYATAYKSANNPDCYQIMTTKNVSETNGGSKISNYPTVAWTKTTCPDISPALVASHAYSVLGTYTPDGGATKYIVLRNPWGVAFSTSILASLAQTGTFTSATFGGNSITLGPGSTKGIFAIKNDVFNTYFEGFGWVQ